MKNYLLPILSLLIFLTACNSNDNSNKQLQDEVIAIHDEVMPMMGTLVRNSMAIDSILNNFAEIKVKHPDIDTVQQRDKLSALKKRIEDANDSMNGWMHDLNLDYENLSNEEVKKYLEEEKSKIQNINKQFKEIDADSKDALSLYKK